MHRHLHTLLPTLAALSLLLVVSGAGAATQHTDVDRLLDSYREAFPVIHFLRAGRTTDSARIDQLPQLLGEGASNVDYEHGEAARQLLVDAQLGRIRMMFENRWPSATLFRVGEDASIHEAYLCVITLDGAPFRGASDAATRIMIGDVAPETLGINVSAHLDNEAFLAFTLHHEVFHCLDAYLNGAMHRKSADALGAAYYAYTAEQRADLYAALVLRQSTTDYAQFLKQLCQYRTLGLLDWDMAHYTAAAIHNAMAFSPDELRELRMAQLVRFAIDVAGWITPSQAIYARFMASAFELALTLDVYEAAQAEEALLLARRVGDPRVLARLEDEIRAARHAVYQTPATDGV